jgi:hypothetical protein
MLGNGFHTRTLYITIINLKNEYTAPLINPDLTLSIYNPLYIFPVSLVHIFSFLYYVTLCLGNKIIVYRVLVLPLNMHGEVGSLTHIHAYTIKNKQQSFSVLVN